MLKTDKSIIVETRLLCEEQNCDYYKYLKPVNELFDYFKCFEPINRLIHFFY